MRRPAATAIVAKLSSVRTHRRGLAGDVGARPAHGHADVGAAERGGVVDAVAGHRDDVLLGAQRIGNAQLGLR